MFRKFTAAIACLMVVFTAMQLALSVAGNYGHSPAASIEVKYEGETNLLDANPLELTGVLITPFIIDVYSETEYKAAAFSREQNLGFAPVPIWLRLRHLII